MEVFDIRNAPVDPTKIRFADSTQRSLGVCLAQCHNESFLYIETEKDDGRVVINQKDIDNLIKALQFAQSNWNHVTR